MRFENMILDTDPVDKERARKWFLLMHTMLEENSAFIEVNVVIRIMEKPDAFGIDFSSPLLFNRCPASKPTLN